MRCKFLSKPSLNAVPEDVRTLMDRLRSRGFSVWLVGGAVRDLMLGKQPEDWDVLTDAQPGEFGLLFERVIPVGIEHGTVLIPTGTRTVEVTSCLRSGKGVLEDLAYRDFTVNAIAISYPDGEVIDPHNGQRDLTAMRLRGVGNPKERFLEDPLRTLRAARLVSVYGFHLHRDTLNALKESSKGLEDVAVERIRDEFTKLILGDRIIDSFSLMRRTGILRVILPELLEGVRKRQNHFHRYDIYNHIVQSVAHAPKRLRVRLAALFHDIGKPRVRQKKGGRFRFYGHASVSAEMAEDILRRWRYPEKLIEEVVLLVRNHMIIDSDRWSDAGVRRFIARVGPELIHDLLDLSEADRKSHVESQKWLGELNRLRIRIDEQLSQKPALRVSDLAITGYDVMNTLGIDPGPKVGEVLEKARALILKYPHLNRRETLVSWIVTTFADDSRELPKNGTVPRSSCFDLYPAGSKKQPLG